LIEGRRVILRSVRNSDIQYFLKWLDDPEIALLLGRYFPTSEFDERRWLIEAPERGDIIFTIIDKATGQPIGNCRFGGIDFKNQRAESGILIGEKDYWGKGYGKEALELLVDYGFTELNLNSIYTLVISSNERSIKTHKQIGFREQGRIRQRIFMKNKFYDMIYFDLLKSEWLQRRKHIKNKTLF